MKSGGLDGENIIESDLEFFKEEIEKFKEELFDNI